MLPARFIWTLAAGGRRRGVQSIGTVRAPAHAACLDPATDTWRLRLPPQDRLPAPPRIAHNAPGTTEESAVNGGRIPHGGEQARRRTRWRHERRCRQERRADIVPARAHDRFGAPSAGNGAGRPSVRRSGACPARGWSGGRGADDERPGRRPGNEHSRRRGVTARPVESLLRERDSQAWPPAIHRADRSLLQPAARYGAAHLLGGSRRRLPRLFAPRTAG